MTTTLDPHFDVAARLGAIFLSEGYPGGPGRPDQAIALLEKGLRHDPTRWQYAHDIGFVHYWWLKDYRSRRGSTSSGPAGCRARRSGCRRWPATTLPDGGDRASARDSCGRSCTPRPTSTGCAGRPSTACAQLQALDDIDALTAAGRRGGAPHRPPAAGRLGRRSWPRGALRGVPDRSDRRRRTRSVPTAA